MPFSTWCEIFTAHPLHHVTMHSSTSLLIPKQLYSSSLLPHLSHISRTITLFLLHRHADYVPVWDTYVTKTYATPRFFVLIFTLHQCDYESISIGPSESFLTTPTTQTTIHPILHFYFYSLHLNAIFYLMRDLHSPSSTSRYNALQHLTTHP